MAPTRISLVVCVLSFIQDGVYREVNQINVATGEVLQLHCVHPNVSWWNDGQTIEPFCSNEPKQFSDAGNYFCNNTEAGQSFYVRAGEKPPPPPAPVCFDSPNSTILCETTKNSNLSEKICVAGYWDKENCMETLSVDLDAWHCLFRCTLYAKASNDFGYATTKKCFPRGIHDKVLPHPPKDVFFYVDSQFKLSGSFSVPDTWKTKSSIDYKITYTHFGIETTLDKIHSQKNETNIKFEFGLQNTDVSWTEVCLKVRIKFGYERAENWSNYSRTVCNYTLETAPSARPENFRVVEDRRRDAHGLVKFSWEPPPKEKRNGFIRHYELLVKESGAGNFSNRTKVTGEETHITLTDVLHEDRDYEVYLTASTNGGKSPEAVLILKARQRIPLALWIALPITSVVAIVLLFHLCWIIHRKMQADHFREAYMSLPEIKMFQRLQGLTNKGPPTPQREVFDTLKSKDNLVIPMNPKMDDDGYSKYVDPETLPLGKDFEGTDSGVLLESSTYSSSGVRSYTLMPSPGMTSPEDMAIPVKGHEPYVDSLPRCTVLSDGTPSSYIQHSELTRNDSGCDPKGDTPSYKNFPYNFST